MNNSWLYVFKKLELSIHLKVVEESVEAERLKGIIVFPGPENVYKAFELTPFEKIKVVILGQDPYHGDGEAMGLAFSVPNDIKMPPSLLNIYKEIEADLGMKVSKNGDLSGWANQGVFLLNTVLTVKKDRPGSHAEIGWQEFTDKVIEYISQKKENVVFVLWGKFAQTKVHLIDKNKHLVLMAPHPSPLSSYRGFFGCKHFSKINAFLRQKGISEIDWQV